MIAAADALVEVEPGELRCLPPAHAWTVAVAHTGAPWIVAVLNDLEPGEVAFVGTMGAYFPLEDLAPVTPFTRCLCGGRRWRSGG